jgi:3-oxoacyl-[acyl-carrier-protein] synthase-3
MRYIEYHLPTKRLLNEDLENIFPDFTATKISEKVGISSRCISSENEFAVDLGIEASRKLILKNGIDSQSIDFLIFCTQSPDNTLPSGSAVIQNSLNLKKSLGSIDINQGCSGYIYGLFLASSILKSGHYKNILLVTADTYTKYITENDKSNRSIFGDGASATLINKRNLNFLDFSLGTDGSGSKNLVAFNSCLKKNSSFSTPELYMNGTEIFNFTIKNVPSLVRNILDKNSLEINDIDLFIFHQANKFMLNHLRKKIGIPDEKFLIDMEDTGNTVSSSIPIVISKHFERFEKSKRILLCGFGVGYSWGACIIDNN